jgi:hypothetical protein
LPPQVNPYGIRARRALGAAARSLGIRVAKLVGALGVTSTLLLLSGCYSYVQKPLPDVVPNDVIEVSISDAGRLALADRAGSQITRVRGKVASRSDSTLDISVSQVSFINGAPSAWQGQELTLRSQDVTQVAQRTLSRTRTLVVALAIGAVAAVAVTATGLTEVFKGSGIETKPEPLPES